MRVQPIRSISKWCVGAAGTAGLAAVVQVGCSLSIGPNAWSSLSLGVPFRQQVGLHLCGAACVQMWRLYCGWPDNLTQAEIYQYMQGTSGVDPAEIVRGINSLTCTSDAVRSMASVYDLSVEIAKQITSIDSGHPVIPLTRNGYHAVVLDGGEYHSDSSGHYWWDTVLVHDPEHFTGDWPISAGLWTDRRAGNFVPFDPSYGTLQQVVSAGAVAYWSYYLAQYGESMGIWDTGCELCIQYPE